MSIGNAVCQFCNGKLEVKYTGMKGYVEEMHYDVLVCQGCGVSSVNPLQAVDEVYEQIYKQAKIIPGYDRYYRYAKLVKMVKNPLLVLSNSESVYWSVSETLKRFFQKSSALSILEIGSGLGYLTYSLNKAGYPTKGIDISKDAIEKAKNRYGNFYEHKNLFKLAEETVRYDCVIMTEVIEHVEEPILFLEAALKLLKPNGKLIVTTPNKNAAPANTLWHSDFPPVHLWFFTEESISFMVSKLNRTCSFFDFTEFSKKFYSPMYVGDIEAIQKKFPRLTKNGEVVPDVIVNDIKTKLLGLYGRYLLSYIKRRLMKKIISARSTTMCVIIS